MSDGKFSSRNPPYLENWLGCCRNRHGGGGSYPDPEGAINPMKNK
jgi:hypothetical protein